MKDSSDDQHLGDAMDDEEPEAAARKTGDGELDSVGQGGGLPQAGGPTHDETETKTDGGA